MTEIRQKSTGLLVRGELVSFDGGGYDSELVFNFRGRGGDTILTIPKSHTLMIETLKKLGLKGLKDRIVDLDANRIEILQQ